MGRVQRCDLGYRAADLGWSTADSGYSDDFDESQGSRGTNAKDFTVCKSPTITLQLDRAQLKLELCEASVLQPLAHNTKQLCRQRSRGFELRA